MMQFARQVQLEIRGQRAANPRLGALQLANAGWRRQGHPRGHVGLAFSVSGAGAQIAGKPVKVIHRWIMSQRRWGLAGFRSGTGRRATS
jgi:hypothetical protein